GEGINYNAYGDEASDQHLAPQALYQRLSRHADPLQLLRGDAIGTELDALRRADLQHALAQPIRPAGAGARWMSLPDAAWSRRVIGILANELASAAPSQAHAVLKADRQGGFVVSLRSPQDAPAGADEFCRRFGGGGRAGAAGIDHLPALALQRFVGELAATHWGD
ncbi:MAG: hypothetical protein MUF16_29330, partial [Burkholderiaceae bacterium]|nr:hypothetical protein [Burkholderiaceae bacterium]